MGLFDDWWDEEREGSRLKRFLKFTERENGRDAAKARLSETVRSHYDSLDVIANDVERLGYSGAARILRELLPRTKRARSGELGEILASEVVEQKLGFSVPVRRLRYKDGREASLRGDDFIGVRYDAERGLSLLKGESKSRSVLGRDAIMQARQVLNRDNGRCTPISLLFVGSRLLERGGDDAELGRAIRDEVATTSLAPRRIEHVLFTLSGNAPSVALKEDLEAASAGRRQTVINVRIENHQEFIGEIYEEAGNLGDD